MNEVFMKALTKALRTQRQIDEDGTEVAVSRQACDEAADAIERDSLDAARYRYIRDQEWTAEIGFCFLDINLGGGNLDEAVDRALGQLTITPEEWKRRYAARLMTAGGMAEKPAIECAQAAWEEDGDAGLLDGSDGLSPEDCADEEMSWWEDDGGEDE